MRRLLVFVFAFAPWCTFAQGTAPGTGSGSLVNDVRGIIDKRDIEGLLVKSSAGSVSAASLVGADPGSLNVVENVRDFSVLLNAFDPNAKAFGIAIAPARTKFPFPRISLQQYAAPDAYFTRLLGNLTLSYAQGKTDEPGEDFTLRAFSVASSGYWRVADDPVVAVANARECAAQALLALPDVKPPSEKDSLRELELKEKDLLAARGDTAAQAVIAAILQKASAGDPVAKKEADILLEAKLQRLAKAGDAQAQKDLDALQSARARAGRFDEAATNAALQAFNTCAAAVLAKLEERWNRSRYSISFGTGSAKRTSGTGDSTGLGNIIAGSMLYGFDGIDALRERAALTVTARYGRNEPVLGSLVSGVKKVNSSLVAVRLAGGSSVFRGLVEGSNARSTDVTTTQRMFRLALGMDYRVLDGLWLNLRYGRQRKLDGSGDETGSFLLLNYSPSASLGR
jgi:hypothetical protein